MFTEIYIEALLVDEDLADHVWELWNAGLISDGVAAWAWCILATSGGDRGERGCSVNS
jgi:hypothetical protein